MDDNQEPPVAVPPKGHPSFFRFGVFFVKDRDGQRTQKEFGSTLEADAVLA